MWPDGCAVWLARAVRSTFRCSLKQPTDRFCVVFSPSPLEPLSHPQLTLLKLYDAHTAPSSSSASGPPPTFLVPLAARLLQAVAQGMDEAASGGRTEFVGERYGKVYEGCVLCLQGVLKAGLLEREAEAEQVRERDGVRALEKAGWLDGVVKTYRDGDGHGLISTLR